MSVNPGRITKEQLDMIDRLFLMRWVSRVVGFLIGVVFFCILAYFTQTKAAETGAVCGGVILEDVIDGDTIRGRISGLPEPLNRVSIRVLGVDTPEKRGKCQAEKDLAKEATMFLSEKFKAAQYVELRWMEWDKYGGRILAEVYFDGKSVSQMMIENKFALPYNGGKKDDWCLKLETSKRKD